MDALIVGAGMSGLMAAQSLRERGYAVQLIERGRSVGGRLATRRVGGGLADHGAQFFTVRSDTLQGYVDRWLAQDLVYIWGTGWSGGSVKRTAGDGHPRFACRGGMNALAKHLARDLDVRINRLVTAMTHDESGWTLEDSAGEVYRGRGLIMTPPVPESLALLAKNGVNLPSGDQTALRRIRFGPCLCGIHEIEGETDLPEPGAVQNFQANVYWVADNQAKGISQTAIVTSHANAKFSRQKLGRARSRYHPRARVGCAAPPESWRANRAHAAQEMALLCPPDHTRGRVSARRHTAAARLRRRRLWRPRTRRRRLPLGHCGWEYTGRGARLMRLRPSRRVFRFAVFALLALVLAIIAALAWLGRPVGELMAEAQAALASDAAVLVKLDPWLSFEPTERTANSGFIFYPGGRVAPEAYAPLARALAQNGVQAVIVPMPLNLAILNPDAASAVIAAYPQVSAWVIGGHSLGGVMAARFAYSNPYTVSGLVLLAAYPEERIDLSERELAVATIYGDSDGLSTPAEIEDSFDRLPAQAQKVRIAGANHAQFGWYGPQAGDLSPAISHREQQNQVVNALLRILRETGI